jgi:hypothetical protein
MVLTIYLLLDLLQLLLHVGGDLFCCWLLDDYGLKIRGVSVAARRNYVAGQETVVVEAQHRLHYVLHLVARDHRPHWKGHWDIYNFPEIEEGVRVIRWWW